MDTAHWSGVLNRKMMSTEDLSVIQQKGALLKAREHEEPLLMENSGRFVLFPIQYHDIWKAYKDHKNAFWTAEEIDFTSDKEDWEKLSEILNSILNNFLIEHRNYRNAKNQKIKKESERRIENEADE
jgi:ribonucleoside-diphosphate reductase subunit M2